MLGIGQWIKVQSVSGTGASAELTLEDGAAEFYKYLNSSGASYTGQTSVGITFEKVEGWGVRQMTNDQVDDSVVVEIFNRWGSYTKGTASHDDWRGMVKPLSGTSNTAGYDLVGTVGERYRSADVVGDHPVANNVTITNYSLEQCTGSKPFNGSTDATHVDDFNSMVHFLGYDTASGDGTKIENSVIGIKNGEFILVNQWSEQINTSAATIPLNVSTISVLICNSTFSPISSEKLFLSPCE